jgi:serine/threonine protein kinase/regulation of enolase protein 1 (concanavalin A-like superfamily)
MASCWAHGSASWSQPAARLTYQPDRDRLDLSDPSVGMQVLVPDRASGMVYQADALPSAEKGRITRSTQTAEQAMIPHNPERGTSPRPSPNGLGGVEDLNVTTPLYTPVTGPPTRACLPGGRSTNPGRFDFLDPPRDEGELGWLAHYRVRRPVGEGGIGLVFLAEDTQLSRPVALKVIKPEMASAPGIQSRFVREAQATAAIKHAHIVTIYQVGRHNDTMFLAMEYLQGLSLQRWLERRRKPSGDLVLRIGREIAGGLAAAHRHGLIHRDIKPANIWLEAPSGRVKILDFGMARSEHEDVQITQSGTVVGTPAYMAPEQARGETVGASSDLFSLGCVLYRLCTGRLPFEGETIMAVLAGLASDTPPSPRQIEPDVQPALDELVMWLLAKDPAARPASAQAVVEAIKTIERTLLAERKGAELSGVASRQEHVDALKQLNVSIDQGPDESHPPAWPLAGRRTWWIATTLLATAAAVGGYVFVQPRKGTHSIVDQQPRLVSASDERAVGKATATEPESPEQSQPEAGPVHFQQGKVRGIVPGKSSTSAPGESHGTAPTGPTQVTGAPEKGDRPAEARPTSRDSAQDVKTGDERPGRDRTEPSGSPGALTKRADRRDDWGEPVIPDGDCKIDLDRPRNSITIVVPGTPHVLSAELGRLNTPRLLRGVKGDFDASVRVAGRFHPTGKTTVQEYAPYHGAGILLWQDQENYVRLEIAADLQHGKVRPYVNFEYRKDGVLADSRGQKITDDSSYLRLKRRGAEILAAFGPDGIRWTSFPPLTAKLKNRLNVGVLAINTATKPLTAELEGFEVSERLGASADANLSVIKPDHH